jgi:hypothetical protein
MAQTGYTPILIYSSSTASQAPSASNLTNSTLGSELAINITDGKLFYKDNANAVQVIGWKTVPTSAGGTGLTTYTAGDLVYYASGTTLTKLAIGASTTILTSSGSAPQWAAASSIAIGTATNLAGGLAGSVPYQSSAGATTFVSIGSAYQAFQVNAGGTAPSWQPSATSVLTAQGDLLYASAANTLARLAKNTTATRYLSNTGTNNDPAWAQVNLADGVTGTLPTANGGTNLTSFTANAVVYSSSTSALATGTGLYFNGSNFRVNTTAAVVNNSEAIAAIALDNFSPAVTGKNSAGSGSATYEAWNNATSGNNLFVMFSTETAYTTRGNIDYNRGAGQVRYNATSDATLKNLIGDANGQRSLEILNTTRIREYAWKDDPNQKPQIGVIAQELYETYKGAVVVGGDIEKIDANGNVTTEYRPWGVDKTAFTFHLIAGWQAHERLIKEQQTIIDQLKADVAALKNL